MEGERRQLQERGEKAVHQRQFSGIHSKYTTKVITMQIFTWFSTVYLRYRSPTLFFVRATWANLLSSKLPTHAFTGCNFTG